MQIIGEYTVSVTQGLQEDDVNYDLTIPEGAEPGDLVMVAGYLIAILGQKTNWGLEASIENVEKIALSFCRDQKKKGEPDDAENTTTGG